MEDIKMNRAIKYRIFPTEEQQIQMSKTFGCVRQVFSMGLEMREGLHAAGFAAMSANVLNNYCNRVWKEEFLYLREVDKFALTNAIKNLDTSYNNYFAKRARHPKFKSKKDRSDSYTTNFTNGNIAITCGDKNRGEVKLPKLGKVAACIHRRPESDRKIKSATISRTPSGKYYVSILFEFKAPAPETKLDPQKAIGLDYSSPDFYVDSNGASTKVLHAYRRSEKRLSRERQRLSRMVKGFNNYEKQREYVAQLEEDVANQRKNFCHQESRKIANSYDIVCVEDLDLHAMAQSLHFGKAVSDNGFGMFRVFLQYKLEAQGKAFVKIDKWYPSTKTCHHFRRNGYAPTVDVSFRETTTQPLIFGTRVSECSD